MMGNAIKLLILMLLLAWTIIGQAVLGIENQTAERPLIIGGDYNSPPTNF